MDKRFVGQGWYSNRRSIQAIKSLNIHYSQSTVLADMKIALDAQPLSKLLIQSYLTKPVHPTFKQNQKHKCMLRRKLQ